jgi:chloride channel protein, CIC family
MNVQLAEEVESPKGLLKLGALAALAGVLIGLIGGAFRFGLAWADTHRTQWIESLHEWTWLGWLAPVLLAAIAAALARWMVRFAPLAAGSGVQHVEAVMRGEAERAPLLVLPVKFFGGLLAIGAGLALGREGPTVQMGSTIGAWIADRCRMAVDDVRSMQAALAGAGLAVAFNAPVGGALFVFEEVSRSFRLRLAVATLISAGVAIAISRAMLGDAPDFRVVNPPATPVPALLAYLVFGSLLGILGVWYNRSTIFWMEAVASLHRLPVEARAALVGATVGLVGWFAPEWIGGGDPLNQELLLNGAGLGVLVLIFGVRWILGPLSYAAGTPGGLFAPLLLVGSTLGLLFAGSANWLLPENLHLAVGAFAVVGMAAFFTAVVRAPFTGIVLIAEMTATTHLLVPMMISCFSATTVATLLKGPPIYDTLRTRMLSQK